MWESEIKNSSSRAPSGLTEGKHPHPLFHLHLFWLRLDMVGDLLYLSCLHATETENSRTKLA